jgi:hypothetical protein
MGGLRMTRNDLATYELMSRAGSDIKSGMLQYGLSRAADVKPETVSSTDLTETTPGTDGMVYDEDTGQYLPKYMDGGKVTEQGLTQLNTPAEGVSEAPEGMRPTFSAKTKTRYRMGDREQDTPFLPEQIEAQRFRNQSDVETRFGNAKEAYALQGMAKGREEEGRSTAIRKSFTDGMKKHADLKPLEAQWKTISGVANTAFEQGDFPTWQKLTESAAGIQSKLMNNAMDRADMITDPKARLTMIVDAHGRYALDGKMGHAVTQNQDGTLNVLNEDGSVLVGNIWPGAEDPSNPKTARSINQVVAFLRDPQKLRELQQRAAENQAKRLADRQDKTWEWQNKPIEVGNGARIVIPGTGQEVGVSRSGQFNVKEAGPVLDDARKILLERSGNFDQTSGKWNWSDETRTKAVTAERLFMQNPTLTPAQLAEIADKGTTGTAVVEVGGKQQRVPAVSYGGRTFILGGDAGSETPQPGQPAAPAVKTSGLGTREVRGKIGPAQGGMQKAPATPAQQGKVEPVSYNAPELDKIAVAAAEENGVPPRLLLALKNAGEKSNNDQVSKKGAAGVMQFMPETAKAYGVDPTNPESAIKGASRYMADLIKQYRGNVAAAVAHYNGGSTQGALVAAGKSPSYPETRAYLERVLAASGAPA